MNITKKNKTQSDISIQSKSFLIISTNFQLEALFNILKKNPSLVNTKDQKNETFLSYAIKRKNIENAELILTSPILDLSYQDQNGNSYLHLAVINQLESIIRTLIQKGINVNLQNNDGNTALHFAYSTGDIKFITIIIESKVDFTIKNKNGLIAEEVSPGTYPEILDINNGNNNSNNVNIIQNKNNTVTINLNLDNNNDNNNKIDNNKDKDNNGIIINERGQINKSIRINWDNNGINDNSNNKNEQNLNNNTDNINNSIIKNDNNINKNNNENIYINNISNNNIYESSNNIINNNVNQSENTSKTKLKFSLVDFSYSDDGEEEVEAEENGIISQKNISKQNEKNNNNSNISENKKKIKSSDIFDLTSSLSYQEKVANASFINSHVVGEPTIMSKDSNEYGINDDIVNINKVKTIENNEEYPQKKNTFNNNMINNGIEASQTSFHTAVENGKNMNLSQVDFDKINGKSANLKENGQNLKFDYNNSLNKEKNGNNEIQNSYKREETFGLYNYDNINNTNLNQSNSYRPQPEFNQDFAFSPLATLKEPLNKKGNGSEDNNINSNNSINNNNSNNINTVKINNEIISENIKLPDIINNNDNKSINLKRCDALKDNKKQNINLSANSNLSNSTLSNNQNNENIINHIARSTPTKSNNINAFNINLSQASQNNINSKTNSKFNFNCPVNTSEDSVNTSTTKNPKDSLYKFLSEIRMEKYYDIFNSNGFDDINLLIAQTKSGTAIKDKQLKEAGLKIPGDRAKILIRLQEKAGNFIFLIPKEVYYISQFENYKSDRSINKLNDWLKSLKVENYLENFVKNGYHSIELMLLQMESKNPLTDEILKDELGINKIGHRSRIINKLLEEAKSLNNKLKTSMLVVGNVLTDKICDCNIY